LNLSTRPINGGSKMIENNRRGRSGNPDLLLALPKAVDVA